MCRPHSEEMSVTVTLESGLESTEIALPRLKPFLSIDEDLQKYEPDVLYRVNALKAVRTSRE
jgi:hypothetical protein